MDENLRRAADELLSALHETESWKRYAALRESVMADEGTAALLRRFAAAQSALQMAALPAASPETRIPAPSSSSAPFCTKARRPASICWPR